MFRLETASRGGAPLFRPFHILKALWHIGESGPVGRKELADMLGIGEGTTRKLVAYLEENTLASTSRQGISLVKAGAAILDDWGVRAQPVHAGGITVGARDFAVRLRGLADRIGKGIEQRDEAIKAGAEGATTLVYLDTLKLSDGSDPECGEPALCRELVGMFDMREGDVLVIGTASEPDMAEDGAFAAALLTIESAQWGPRP